MNRLEQIANKLNEANLPDVDFVAYLKNNVTDNEKVKRVSDYYNEIEEYIEKGNQVLGAKMPFPKLDKLFGFRGGEVSLFSGYNSHKKSMMLGFIAINLLKQGENVTMASFEMKPVSTIKRMTKQYTQVNEVGYNEFADFMTFAANNFFILDQMGGMTAQRLYGVIAYCAKELNVKHFIIDSLMRIIPKEDDYNAQKDFVVKLCEFAQSLDIHIHLVHHTTKGNEKILSSRYDAKGTGAISDNVHNSWIVWANKEKLENTPDVILKCDKQREGEWEGSIALNFDSETMTFSEKFEGIF